MKISAECYSSSLESDVFKPINNTTIMFNAIQFTFFCSSVVKYNTLSCIGPMSVT